MLRLIAILLMAAPFANAQSNYGSGDGYFTVECRGDKVPLIPRVSSVIRTFKMNKKLWDICDNYYNGNGKYQIHITVDVDQNIFKKAPKKQAQVIGQKEVTETVTTTSVVLEDVGGYVPGDSIPDYIVNNNNGVKKYNVGGYVYEREDANGNALSNQTQNDNKLTNNCGGRDSCYVKKTVTNTSTKTKLVDVKSKKPVPSKVAPTDYYYNWHYKGQKIGQTHHRVGSWWIY